MANFLKSRLWQLTGLAFFCAAACSTAAILFFEHHSLDMKRKDAADVAQANLMSIDSSIDLALSATYALAALVQQGNGTVANFEKVAGEMLKLYPGVAALQLAPDGVVRQTVPLPGNERAIGHDLLRDPARTKEAFLARKMGKLTLAGPFPLIQGGFGAVGRLPVFLPAQDGERAFWGFTTVLINIPDLLDAAGLDELVQQGYQYELYRIHPDTGKKHSIASSTGGVPHNPVELPLAVPNGNWTLAVAPERGWHSAGSIVAEVLLGLLLSLMMALIVKLLAQGPMALRHEVANRTRELKESIDRFSLLLNSAAEGIYGVDTSGCCTFINDSALKRIGYHEKSLVLGKNMHQLIHYSRKDGTRYMEIDCPIFCAFSRGDQVHRDDEHFWHADGTLFPVEYWSYPMRDADGHIIGAVVSFLDISERVEKKRLEEQLLHAQKMEAVGLLAGGIAHDFNNILSAIVGYAELIKEQTKDSPRAVNSASNILSAADRAGRLTRQLLLYSRKQAPVRVLTDLNELVEGMDVLLHRLVGEHVDLRKRLWPEKIVVEVDVNQIEQILMNLCINARDAMPGGGIISISTRVISIDESSLVNFGVDSPGQYAYLSVADTGVGIDKQTQERIFEPFFTTKEAGGGSGLGLATVYGVMGQHGGTIKVYSEPGMGTVFRLLLKVSSLPPQHPRQTEAVNPFVLLRGKEKVLIADDEGFIRDALYETLTAAGYRVLTAVDGNDAIARLRGEKDGVELLLLDMIMPGMNGREVWEHSRKICPGARFIFMSGYTADIMKNADGIPAYGRFLEKPFSSSDLLHMVRAVLDEDGH